MSKLTPSEIDDMFDISSNVSNIDSTSDYNNVSDASLSVSSSVSFEDRVNNIKMSMPYEISTTDVPSVDEASITTTVPVSEVNSKNAAEVAEVVMETETETETETEIKNSKDNNIEDDNPLGLASVDLDAYNQIKIQYPQFCLYDGSMAFRDFYTYKLKVLKWILTSFKILPLKEMRKEIIAIKLNHQVGNNIASPGLIRQKLDNVGMCCTRLTELIIQALDQFPIWKKNVEMLKSKLAKDHDSRGQYKRDALELEHMFDLVNYQKELEGFIDSANFVDNFLKRISDNLSRQLSCILTKSNDTSNNGGVVYGEINVDNINNNSNSKTDDSLDSLDTVQTGLVISKPVKEGLVDFNFGSDNLEDDEFSVLG